MQLLTTTTDYSSKWKLAETIGVLEQYPSKLEEVCVIFRCGNAKPGRASHLMVNKLSGGSAEVKGDLQAICFGFHRLKQTLHRQSI